MITKEKDYHIQVKSKKAKVKSKELRSNFLFAFLIGTVNELIL